MQLRTGPYFILRHDKGKEPIVTGGTTVGRPDENARAWMIKEMLRQAANISPSWYEYTIANGMNPQIDIDRTDITVTVSVGNTIVTFSAVHAEDHLRIDTEEEKADDDDTEATATRSDTLRTDLTHCQCGHGITNHNLDDGDVYCKVCDDYGDECQDLLIAAA